jgi:hypothetical protein
MVKQRGSEMPDYLAYPPLSEEDAKTLFPGEGFTVTVKPKKDEDAVAGQIVEVAFKDLNALMATPYGQARSLSLTREGDKLVLASLSGLLPAIQAGQSEEMRMVPTVGDLKEKANQLAGSFTVTLPAAVDSSNGTAAGTSVTWVMEREKTKDVAEAMKVFGRTMRATCPAAGIGFSPSPPPRLGLLPFAELKEGPSTHPVAIPKAEAVTAAARFVPYVLGVIRSFDLAGEGAGSENEATLVGAIALPRELEPGRWGEIRVEDVLDDQGKDLKAKDRGYFRLSHYADQLKWEEQRRGATADIRHFVSIGFKVPDRSAKKLSRIKAAIDLHYFGAPETLKLKNAIPKEWVTDPRRGAVRREPEAERQLTLPRLNELGMAIRVTNATQHGSGTSLQFRVSSEKTALLGLQLFDAEGLPWPTLSPEPHGGGDDRWYSVSVPGTPEPPFSLALLVSGERTTVEVPITLQDIPLTGPPEKPAAPEPKPE